MTALICYFSCPCCGPHQKFLVPFKSRALDGVLWLQKVFDPALDRAHPVERCWNRKITFFIPYVDYSPEAVRMSLEIFKAVQSSRRL